MKAKKVIIDGGCSSIVVAVESISHLKQIFEMYHNPDIYDLRIVPCVGITGVSYVLSAKMRNSNKLLPVKLCTDLIPDKPESTFYVSTLQYAICRDDMEEIVSNVKMSSCLSTVALTALTEYINKTERSLSVRLEYTLIGQAVLHRLSSLKYRDIEFYVNPSHYMPDMWKIMEQQEAILTEAFNLVPGVFQIPSSSFFVDELVTVKFFNELEFTYC